MTQNLYFLKELIIALSFYSREKYVKNVLSKTARGARCRSFTFFIILDNTNLCLPLFVCMLYVVCCHDASAAWTKAVP